jgi:hypothetical protein
MMPAVTGLVRFVNCIWTSSALARKDQTKNMVPSSRFTGTRPSPAGDALKLRRQPMRSVMHRLTSRSSGNTTRKRKLPASLSGITCATIA